MFTEEEKIIRMSNIYNNQLLSALPLCVHLVCVMGDVPSNSDEELRYIKNNSMNKNVKNQCNSKSRTLAGKKRCFITFLEQSMMKIYCGHVSFIVFVY